MNTEPNQPANPDASSQPAADPAAQPAQPSQPAAAAPETSPAADVAARAQTGAELTSEELQIVHQNIAFCCGLNTGTAKELFGVAEPEERNAIISTLESAGSDMCRPIKQTIAAIQSRLSRMRAEAESG